jgi:hypothetical protein
MVSQTSSCQFTIPEAMVKCITQNIQYHGQAYWIIRNDLGVFYLYMRYRCVVSPGDQKLAKSVIKKPQVISTVSGTSSYQPTILASSTQY